MTLFRPRDLAISAVLFVITILTFWSATRCGFVLFDDTGYVSSHPRVLSGLTINNIGWAMTTGEMSNWHPLTWISLMADASMFGKEPWGFHATSVVIHAINAVLLFLVLRAMTGSTWRCAVAAALFAVHPLRVESVAWISERKDVLSTFFGLLALGAYFFYAKRPSSRRYGAVMGMMALSLMAKPMLVTLPGVLLLLDYWPLKRPARVDGSARTLRELVVEKIPLACLSLLCCVATFLTQRAAGSVTSLEHYSLWVRLCNAIVSYVRYIEKMIWPSGLAVFYPHPGAWPIAIVAGALAAIVGVSVVAWKRRDSSPALATGWFWYLLTLLPVIGLIQVGGQAMADRYTYVPMIGLVIAIVFAWPESWIVSAMQRRATLGAAIAVILVLAVTAHAQVAHWQSSATLFAHAVDVTKNNALAQNNLGVALAAQGDAAGARAHYLEAIRIHPESAQSFDGLAILLANQGNTAGAIDLFEKAVHIDPAYEPACRNLGGAYTLVGRNDDAITQYRHAIALRPSDAQAHEGLAHLLSLRGDHAGAIEQELAAIAARPDLAEPHVELGVELAVEGHLREAVIEFQTAIAIDPANEGAKADLQHAQNQLGRAASIGFQ